MALWFGLLVSVWFEDGLGIGLCVIDCAVVVVWLNSAEPDATGLTVFDSEVCDVAVTDGIVLRVTRAVGERVCE